MLPVLITLATVALAGLLGWAMWGVYMGAPWTRDATVRAYVVTMAPEVAGRIVELHVVDNKYVRKGDLLMVIDPTNYSDRRQSGRGGGAAGAGERAEHRRADDRPAGADQRQPGTAGSGAGGARVRAAAGGALPGPGAKRLRARVQNAQQFTSQLHQQEAALQSCASRTSSWRSGNSSR